MKTRSSLTKALALGWVAFYTSLCYASFGQETLTFDWFSLAMALLAGLCGGLLRTILVLASDRRILIDVLRECWRDLIFAGVGGIVVYGILQGLTSLGWFTVPKDLRVLLICGAGFSRGAWLRYVERNAAVAAERGEAWLGSRGGFDRPSSAMPLEDKK